MSEVEQFLNELTENREGARKIVSRLIHEGRCFYLLERMLKQGWTGPKIEWADCPDLLEKIRRSDPELISKVNEKAYKEGIKPVRYA